MTELPPLPPDYANPVKASVGSAGLSGALLAVCLHLGYTPEQADQIWYSLRGTYPQVLPSLLFKQIEDAGKNLFPKVDTSE